MPNTSKTTSSTDGILFLFHSCFQKKKLPISPIIKTSVFCMGNRLSRLPSPLEKRTSTLNCLIFKPTMQWPWFFFFLNRTHGCPVPMVQGSWMNNSVGRTHPAMTLGDGRVREVFTWPYLAKQSTTQITWENHHHSRGLSRRKRMSQRPFLHIRWEPVIADEKVCLSSRTEPTWTLAKPYSEYAGNPYTGLENITLFGLSFFFLLILTTLAVVDGQWRLEKAVYFRFYHRASNMKVFAGSLRQNS